MPLAQVRVPLSAYPPGSTTRPPTMVRTARPVRFQPWNGVFRPLLRNRSALIRIRFLSEKITEAGGTVGRVASIIVFDGSLLQVKYSLHDFIQKISVMRNNQD